MTGKIWFTSEDGNIEYASLTKQCIEGTLEVLRKSFFLQESLSIACGIPYDPEGKKELEELCLEAAKDGISIIAIDRKVNKVAGVAFNKFHVMFLAVLPEYQGRKIGTNLVKISFDAGKKLNQGENVKQTIGGELTLDPIPGIVTATLTSNISQGIGEKAGFKLAASIHYEEFKRNGKTYYDLLEKKQEKSNVVYKLL